jgi:hypothetical protein
LSEKGNEKERREIFKLVGENGNMRFLILERK